MSDVMRPVPFINLLNWILTEYKNHSSIFSIPESTFYKKQDTAFFEIFGEKCETALGPAAGPHTQQAPNLVAAYLTGGRFFEIKTVQILDSLEIEKPCIDTPDEAYNTEWSTEFSVQEAFDEYVKGWFLLHMLNKMLGLSKLEERGFVFNMSVGYDLKGIKSPKIDNFIEGLKDASDTPIFKECVSVLKEAIAAGKVPGITDPAFAESISPKISRSITLSTMHGTPPDEQESICRYLISEKKVHTFVKLNPTLLGYEYVQSVFDKQGFDHIRLKEESFSHDMQYPDAVNMIRNLQSFAAENGVSFGVKLTNTLAVVNEKGKLPTDEMYMSGRALYPLTVNLSNKLAHEFSGDIIISYSGGASAFNITDLFTSGIRPITLATDLLKPGGYSRLKQLADLLEPFMAEKPSRTMDLPELQKVADQAFTDPRYHKDAKSHKPMKINQEVPLLDCFVAPCIVACPVHQDIPEYIQLIEDGRYLDAYELIISTNAMPFTTGFICESACELKCVRNDYEEPVRIRDLKRIAAERGYDAYKQLAKDEPPQRDAKVAVIGAGPAGISSAYFLSREGFDVTVFDKTDKIGGMVTHGIVDFRIPTWAIENDIELIENAGVKFEMKCDPAIDIDSLKADGYTYINLAIGAWKSRQAPIEGDTENILSAIPFLRAFKNDSNSQKLGKHVAIIGAGNSAMDAARAAVRVDGVESVTIVYRRSKKEMPATREEYLETVHDGIKFIELASPISLKDGVLHCQKMELGEKDDSGRRRPVPADGEFIDLKIDTVITAIGELVDYQLLESNKIEVSAKGEIKINENQETSLENVFISGDAFRGPSSIIEAIADGRAVADAIMKKEGVTPSVGKTPADYIFDKGRPSEMQKRKGLISPRVSTKDFDTKFVPSANRCLACNIDCNKCVNVCPNIANLDIKVDGLVDSNQILHLEALCNECGNCEVFCPYQSDPAKDKFTLYWNVDEFEKGEHTGYVFTSETGIKMRYSGNIFSLNLNNGSVQFEDNSVKINEEMNGLLKIIEAVHKDYDYLEIRDL